jgi:hypothetical protein
VNDQTQSSFDFEAARDARDEAVTRVGANADQAWAARALQAVGFLAMTQPTFTSDDVWAMLADSVTTHEPRALGFVLKRAASLGYCEATDAWVQSARPDCHARPIRVWRSLLGD